ncbi:MAG TPA: hypothetical protein VEJ67_14540 [Candidatus Cybelea sp.]|nr:hypothetical protein [Candidatus Cybelea sp.]
MQRVRFALESVLVVVHTSSRKRTQIPVNEKIEPQNIVLNDMD